MSGFEPVDDPHEALGYLSPKAVADYKEQRAASLTGRKAKPKELTIAEKNANEARAIQAVRDFAEGLSTPYKPDDRPQAERLADADRARALKESLRSKPEE